MTSLRVLTDTGVLLAMLAFPLDKHGELTLAGEVKQLYAERAFDLVLCLAVAQELDEIIDLRYPVLRPAMAAILRPHVRRMVRWPTPDEIARVLPSCPDPDDAPIFASALIAKPDVILSNDFRAFHDPAAKSLWHKNGIEVESLFGLLARFGRRERKQSE